MLWGQAMQPPPSLCLEPLSGQLHAKYKDFNSPLMCSPYICSIEAHRERCADFRTGWDNNSAQGGTASGQQEDMRLNGDGIEPAALLVHPQIVVSLRA